MAADRNIDGYRIEVPDASVLQGLESTSYTAVPSLGKPEQWARGIASDPRLARDVALKVLPDASAPASERMAWFEREAKVLASRTSEEQSLGGGAW
jgi:hypothetical protein